MSDKRAVVGEAPATMRLRDRKSGVGVLGDITNKKDEASASQNGAKVNVKKVRFPVVGTSLVLKIRVLFVTQVSILCGVSRKLVFVHIMCSV